MYPFLSMPTLSFVFLFVYLVHLIAGHTDSIASLAFSHDGQLLASGGLDSIVNIWDSSTGALKQKLEGPGEAIEVSDGL